MTLRELYLSRPALNRKVRRSVWVAQFGDDSGFPFHMLETKISEGNLSLESTIANDWVVVPESGEPT